jgi:hypothetical protein
VCTLYGAYPSVTARHWWCWVSAPSQGHAPAERIVPCIQLGRMYGHSASDVPAERLCAHRPTTDRAGHQRVHLGGTDPHITSSRAKFALALTSPSTSYRPDGQHASACRQPRHGPEYGRGIHRRGDRARCRPFRLEDTVHREVEQQ